MTTEELVAYVRKTATARYTRGGWDVIVEAWDDEDIAEVIAGARTERGALRKIKVIVDVYKDRQGHARNCI